MNLFDMSKRILLAILMTVCLSKTLHAGDLPIDITAIGRQEAPTGRVTHRIGANLFTADSQSVNDVFAARIQLRQDTALSLFEYVSFNYNMDSHTRIMNTASDLALFSQPTHITTFNNEQDSQDIPTWLMALVLTLCAAAGFVWALKSIAKKRRQAESVY